MLIPRPRPSAAAYGPQRVRLARRRPPDQVNYPRSHRARLARPVAGVIVAGLAVAGCGASGGNSGGSSVNSRRASTTSSSNASLASAPLAIGGLVQQVDGVLSAAQGGLSSTTESCVLVGTDGTVLAINGPGSVPLCSGWTNETYAGVTWSVAPGSNTTATGTGTEPAVTPSCEPLKHHGARLHQHLRLHEQHRGRAARLRGF